MPRREGDKKQQSNSDCIHRNTRRRHPAAATYLHFTVSRGYTTVIPKAPPKVPPARSCQKEGPMVSAPFCPPLVPDDVRRGIVRMRGCEGEESPLFWASSEMRRNCRTSAADLSVLAVWRLPSLPSGTQLCRGLSRPPVCGSSRLGLSSSLPDSLVTAVVVGTVWNSLDIARGSRI